MAETKRWCIEKDLPKLERWKTENELWELCLVPKVKQWHGYRITRPTCLHHHHHHHRRLFLCTHTPLVFIIVQTKLIGWYCSRCSRYLLALATMRPQYFFFHPASVTVAIGFPSRKRMIDFAKLDFSVQRPRFQIVFAYLSSCPMSETRQWRHKRPNLHFETSQICKENTENGSVSVFVQEPRGPSCVVVV